MFEFLFGAALIPVLIVACVGVVCCVIVGVVSYYSGKHQSNKENREQQRLKEELRAREKEVRQSASNLAQQTAKDAKEFVQQAKEQRQHIATNTNKLDKEVVKVETAAVRLETTSIELSNASTNANNTVNDVTAELNQLQIELTALNQELKSTKDSLTEKEATLLEVVVLLGDTQRSLQENTQKSKDDIDGLTRQLSEAQDLLRGALSNTESVKDVEIVHLRTDNERMAGSIQRLETTLNSYKTELRSLSQTNRQKLDQITALHNENKQLTQAITQLSDALEAKTDSSKEPPSSSRGFRLFTSS